MNPMTNSQPIAWVDGVFYVVQGRIVVKMDEKRVLSRDISRLSPTILHTPTTGIGGNPEKSR